jgi:exodeoxyribonuclease VII small subunit
MAKKTQSPPKSFEDGMRELEAILSEMENGQIGLEESLTRYERGAFLIQHCRSVLSAAQTQIEQLTRSPDGEPRLAPVADDVAGGVDGKGRG